MIASTKKYRNISKQVTNKKTKKRDTRFVYGCQILKISIEIEEEGRTTI
jgi:hypothetical protein